MMLMFRLFFILKLQFQTKSSWPGGRSWPNTIGAFCLSVFSLISLTVCSTAEKREQIPSGKQKGAVGEEKVDCHRHQLKQ